MIIRNPRDLGKLLRDRREQQSLSQQALADEIGASRYWVMDVEKGKSTAEVGLILRALTALGLAVDIRDRAGSPAAPPDLGVNRAEVDLTSILQRSTGSTLDIRGSTAASADTPPSVSGHDASSAHDGSDDAG